MGFPLWSTHQYCETNLICVELFAVFFSFQCKVFRQNQHTIEQLVTRTILRLFCRKIDRITLCTPLSFSLRWRETRRVVFVPSGSFCFSATLSLLYHQCIAFVFLLGYAGLPLVSGSKRPCPLLCKFTLAGYINAGSGCPPYAMMGARTRSINGQRSGQSRSTESLCHAFGLRCAACKDVHVYP